MSKLYTTINEFRKTINENNSKKYKELEFMCHNSDFDVSTNKESQKSFYDDLKKIQISSNYKILPYMQDFSDDEHTELSLAVVILDKTKEQDLEKIIMNTAKKHNIEFDLYGERNDYEVNSLIRGDLYNNMI